uniref:Uncharacterized protein n=1 Tax=Fibrocapsa japonica TaxID=94617 RepID=A0A7S2V1M9_9STRA
MNALTPEELQEANSLASRIEAIEAHTAAAAEAEAQGVQVEEEDYADEEVEDNGASCVLCPDNADPSTCLLYLDGFVASLANTERRTVQETMFGIKCQDTANAEDCAQMLDSHYIRMDTETRLHLLLNSCESGPLLQSVSSRFGTEPMELTSLKNLLPWNWKNPWKKQKKSEPAPAPAEEEEAVVEVTEEPEPLETDEPVVEPTGEALDMPTEVPEATEEVTAPTADIEGESADELIDEIAASSDVDASDLLPSSSADEEDTSSALAPVVAPVAHEADECVLCSRTDPACLLYLYAFVASLSVEAQATIHRTIFNGADTCMEGEDDDDCLYRLDDKFDSLSAEDRLDLLKTSCAAGAMLPYIAGRLGVSPEELAGIKDLLPWNWRPSEADFNPEAVRSEGAIVEKIVAKETAPRSDGTQAPCILCPEGDDSVCLLRLYEFVSSLPYQERQAVHQSIFGEDSCSGAKKELECVKYLDQQFVQMDPRKRLELLTDSCVNGPLYQYITDQIIGLAPGQMLFGLSPMEMWSVQPGFPKPREQVPQLPVDFNLIYSYSFEMPNPEAELLGRTDMGLWDSNLVEGGEGKGEDLTWPWKDVIPPGTVAEDKLAPDLNVLEVEPQVHGLSFSYDGAAMLSYNFLGSDELHTMIKGGNKGGKGKLSYDLSGDSLELDKGKVSYDLSGFLEAQDGAGFDLTEDQMMRLSSQVGRQAGLKPFGSYLRSGLELDEISTAPGLSPLGAAIALIKEGGVSSILVLVGVVVMSLGMVIRSRERRRDGYASL